MKITLDLDARTAERLTALLDAMNKRDANEDIPWTPKTVVLVSFIHAIPEMERLYKVNPPS